MGKGGRVEDDGVKGLAPTGEAGEDSANILGPEAVRRPVELIELVVGFSASKRAGGGVDIEGFSADGSGQNPKGAGVSKEVQQASWAKGFEVKAIFSLIWKKSRGDVGREVDGVA